MHLWQSRCGRDNVTVCTWLQERAHKHALQRVIRADAFAVEHKRVNEWDLSDVMATFANQYRQELRYILQKSLDSFANRFGGDTSLYVD